MKKKLHENIFAKISLTLVSLIITLVVTEVSLKTIGYFYNLSFQASYLAEDEESEYQRDEVYEHYRSEKTKDIILSIGDSFTNAGNVQRKFSYPHQLYKIYSENKTPSTILNMGLCEDSTFGVQKRLENYFQENKEESKKPTKVIVLVGAADNYSFFDFEEPVEVRGWHKVQLHRWYSGLSIYKVIRHIRYYFIQRKLTGMKYNSDIRDEEYKVANKNYIKLKDSVLNNMEAKEKASLLNLVKKDFSPRFKNYFNNNMSYMDKASITQTMHLLVVYMSKILTSELKHGEAFNLILDFASFDPIHFWNGSHDDAYFRIIQTFQFQSEVDSKDVLEKLRKMEVKSPSISNSKYFKEFSTLVNNRDDVFERTNTLRVQAWKNIIELSKKYNFELIAMNYPSNYISANSIIKKVTDQYGIQLIDNNSYFNSLIEKNGRDTYLEDDDHLTPLGYELLAKKIYNEIK